MRERHAWSFFLACSFAFACPSLSLAGCPPNTLECLVNDFLSTDPASSATCSGPPDDPGNGNVSYDLPAGHLALNAGGFDWSGGIYCSDDFQLLGMAPGSHATITMLGHLKVSWSRSLKLGSMSFQLNSGVTGVNGIAFYGTGSVDTTFTMPLALASGQKWVVINNLVEGQGGGTTKLTYDYTFSNLPSGAFVASCQGFRQESPVLALPVTWGECKALYR